MKDLTTYDEQSLFRAAVSVSAAKEELRKRTLAQCKLMVPLYIKRYAFPLEREDEMIDAAFAEFERCFANLSKSKYIYDDRFFFLEGYNYTIRQECVRIANKYPPTKKTITSMVRSSFLLGTALALVIAIIYLL